MCAFSQGTNNSDSEQIVQKAVGCSLLNVFQMFARNILGMRCQHDTDD